MRIKILSISERQPEWVQMACADYARRLPKHLAPIWIDLPLARHREDRQRAKDDEAARLVAALPVTSIVALHDLNHAAMFCDRLAVMDKSRVAASGTPQEVLTETLLREVLDVDARIGP